MEDTMSVLKSLSLTALPQLSTNPTLERRNRTVARLDEQKRLLTDPNYVRKVKVSVVVDGVRKITDKDQRVLPWWRQQADGTFLLTIRSGSKAIEFEKGKAAVTVATREKLPPTIDALIAAVRSGELDAQLAAGSKPPPVRKR
jgi:hypothetical protein